jgi:hypothetical protein
MTSMRKLFYAALVAGFAAAPSTALAGGMKGHSAVTPDQSGALAACPDQSQSGEVGALDDMEFSDAGVASDRSLSPGQTLDDSEMTE